MTKELLPTQDMMKKRVCPYIAQSYVHTIRSFYV